MWTVGEIQRVLRARWSSPPGAQRIEAPVTGFSIDSRTIEPGQAFIALHGERFDGHDFIPDAVCAGSGAVIAERAVSRSNAPMLVVPDAHRALFSLALAHRATLGRTTVIGVTGSNGKTTTCRLLHAALSARLTGTCSERSFNNHIGVPLTILRADPGDAYVICEVGANAPGEVHRLGALIRPDICVITSVGRAHIGGFGSLEAIAREKSSLASLVPADGWVIAPETPWELDEALRSCDARLMRIGSSADAELFIVAASHTEQDGGTALRVEMEDRRSQRRSSFEAPLIGLHNASNIACAVAAARLMGLRDGAIRQGLAQMTPAAMRMQRARVAGVDVFNDAYNANPDSLQAALDAFLDLTAGASRRVVVLGDMLELGDSSRAEHESAARCAVSDDRIDQIVGVGEAMAAALAVHEDGSHGRVRTVAEPADAAVAAVSALVREGDALLLKGSRLMRLERIADALSGRVEAMAGAGR